MSKVRGRSQEDPTPEGWWPRGVTPRLRSGAAAESSRLRRCRNGQEELPKSEVRGGGREEIPREQGQGRQPGGATPLPHAGGQEQRLGGPTPVQGVVAARAQEGLEELFHVQGQEGQQ